MLDQPREGFPLPVSAFACAKPTFYASNPSRISVEVKRLALTYVWVTIASSAIVFSEPALYDVLMLGAAFMLPVAGLVSFSRGLALYLLLWAAIVAGGLVGTTQAGILDVPTTHVSITLYLAFSSVVMVGFVAQNPDRRIRLIMSAYLLAALIGAFAGLIGYFNVVPGAYGLFTTDFGRAQGTFKDPNVLGAFLVPALLYVLHLAMRQARARANFCLLAMPILLFGSLLAFSRGAWVNLAVSLVAYSCISFATVATHRQRLKLVVFVMFAGIFALAIFAAAMTIPTIYELMTERAILEQSYDVGPEGRFGGQEKAVGLALTHPLGIGALEFGRAYHHEDVHEVYLSMYLSTGWIGGALYIALVLLTIGVGLRQVVSDRGGDEVGVVLVAAFIGMALEGVVIDTDHWRHFYLIMAMIWGLALAAPRSPLELWRSARPVGCR